MFTHEKRTNCGKIGQIQREYRAKKKTLPKNHMKSDRKINVNETNEDNSKSKDHIMIDYTGVNTIISKNKIIWAETNVNECTLKKEE